MALHLREHFIHLGDFPRMARRGTISQQRVGFVQNEEGAHVAGFLEGAVDRLFRVAQITRNQVGIRFVERVHFECLGEMTRIGRSGKPCSQG